MSTPFFRCETPKSYAARRGCNETAADTTACPLIVSGENAPGVLILGFVVIDGPRLNLHPPRRQHLNPNMTHWNRFPVVLFFVCIGPALSSDAVVAEDTVSVEIQTSAGLIEAELFPDKAPASVANFVRYAKDGFYDGTVFHRVIEGFMIQGGGRDKELKKKATRDPIKNEAGNGLTNDTYTLAMARTRAPDSATSQFFINTVDNESLNRPNPDGYGYAVFGRVTGGKEVVEKIEGVEVQAVPDPDFPAALMQSVPVEPVIIQSVKVVETAATENGDSEAAAESVAGEKAEDATVETAEAAAE